MLPWVMHAFVCVFVPGVLHLTQAGANKIAPFILSLGCMRLFVCLYFCIPNFVFPTGWCHLNGSHVPSPGDLALLVCNPYYPRPLLPKQHPHTVLICLHFCILYFWISNFVFHTDRTFAGLRPVLPSPPPPRAAPTHVQ